MCCRRKTRDILVAMNIMASCTVGPVYGSGVLGTSAFVGSPMVAWSWHRSAGCRLVEPQSPPRLRMMSSADSLPCECLDGCIGLVSMVFVFVELQWMDGSGVNKMKETLSSLVSWKSIDLFVSCQRLDRMDSRHHVSYTACQSCLDCHAHERRGSHLSPGVDHGAYRVLLCP